jgi:site-specific DNA-cytosine methylase
MKTIEFFSGIGGMAFALGDRGALVRAYDQNRIANRVYRLNHGIEPSPKNVTSLCSETIRNHGAQLWMLSPPCQPYTVRGKGRDLEDPRAEGLIHLMNLIPDCRPPRLLLENVVPFGKSMSRSKLLGTLQRLEYEILEKTLCPTDLGIPNRRPRYYLLASRKGIEKEVSYKAFDRPLSSYLDKKPLGDLELKREILNRLGNALNVAGPGDICACFTRSYGRTFVRSGSYLETDNGVRYFSPDEIARLLHFPPSFRFPDDLGRRDRYRLLGNSVNVAVIGELLRHLA